MPFAKVDDGKVSLYYEVHGEGEQKVLFVMGLGSSGLAWELNVAWLIDNHPEYQCCFFDNRGIGKSDVPKGRYTTSMMAKDAVDLADSLGWNKFHVVGISMGGMISQEIALMAKERVISLCLGVTHSGGPGSIPPLSGSVLILKNITKKTIEERAPGTVDVLFSPKFLEETAPNGKTNRQNQLERIIDLGNRLPPPSPQGFRSQILAVQTHSVGNRRLAMLRNRQFPILVITGTEDMLVNPKASFFLNEALKADDFVLLKGCGHGINMERFDDYNQAILRNFRAGHEKLSVSQSTPALHLHNNNNNNNNNNNLGDDMDYEKENRNNSSLNLRSSNNEKELDDDDHHISDRPLTQSAPILDH